MISEGSCDTEDWNAENSDLITGTNYILKYIKYKTMILNCNNIPQFKNVTVFVFKEMHW